MSFLSERSQLGNPFAGAFLGGGGGSTLLTNLVAAYKLADTSDSSGNSHALTNDNAVSFSNAGQIGNCATFVATSSQSLHVTSSAFNFGNTNYTISLWVYVNNAATNQMFLGKDSDTQGREYLIDVNASLIEFGVFVGGSLKSVTDAPNGGLTNGTWHLVTAWWDSAATTVGMQVDARSAVTLNAGGGADSGTGPLYLGRRAYSGFEGYLDGRLDNCNVWSRVLTPTERTTLWNGGAGTEYPFL